jgi:hypothetical protein
VVERHKTPLFFMGIIVLDTKVHFGKFKTIHCCTCTAAEGILKTEDELSDSRRRLTLREEEKRMRYLRFIVDLTRQILLESQLSRDEAVMLIASTRRCVLKVFPDKGEVYDLIYAPRFEKILLERWAEILH